MVKWSSSTICSLFKSSRTGKGNWDIGIRKFDYSNLDALSTLKEYIKITDYQSN
jgi:hypothetical protein